MHTNFFGDSNAICKLNQTMASLIKFQKKADFAVSALEDNPLDNPQ